MRRTLLKILKLRPEKPARNSWVTIKKARCGCKMDNYYQCEIHGKRRIPLTIKT